MSTPKETDFFLKRTDKSLEWYQQRFKEEAQVFGEASPNYAKYPEFEGVPERIHQLLPNAKLLYLVRDPVERAISHYIHSWAAGRTSKPIKKAFRPVEESWYLTVSQYYMQLSRYLRWYSIDDILVISSKRLRERRHNVMEEIFQFIGVRSSLKGDTLVGEYHKSEDKKRPTKLLSFLIRSRLGRTLKGIGKQIVPRVVVQRVRGALLKDAEKPELSDRVLRETKEYLKKDVKELRRLTGKEFASWSM